MRLNNNYNICCGRLYRVSGFPAASGLSYFQVGGLTASHRTPPFLPLLVFQVCRRPLLRLACQPCAWHKDQQTNLKEPGSSMWQHNGQPHNAALCPPLRNTQRSLR